MVGLHHQLHGHEFEQAQRYDKGQGKLACYSAWGCKESDMTEQPNNNSNKSERQYKGPNIKLMADPSISITTVEARRQRNNILKILGQTKNAYLVKLL